MKKSLNHGELHTFEKLDEEQWNVAFGRACQGSHLSEIKRLCHPYYQDVSNIHMEQEAGFRWASQNGHVEVVRYLTVDPELVEHGHDPVDIVNYAEDSWAAWGITVASAYGHLSLLQFLLADPEVVKKRGSGHFKLGPAFEAACAQGCVPILEYLSTSPDLPRVGQPHANIHARGEAGFTEACGHRRLEAVQFLTASPVLLAHGKQCVNVNGKAARLILESILFKNISIKWYDILEWLIVGLPPERALKLKDFDAPLIPDERVRAMFRAQQDHQAITQAVHTHLKDRPPQEGIVRPLKRL